MIRHEGFDQKTKIKLELVWYEIYAGQRSTEHITEMCGIELLVSLHLL